MKHLFFFLILFVFSVISCQSKQGEQMKSKASDVKVSTQDYFVNMYKDTIPKVVKSEEEWKKILSPQEYYVLRQKGTEMAFTGDLLEVKSEGLFTCRGCGLPLFDTKHKFDSGTGWPSFYNVLDKTCITEDTDYDLGYPRTELTCSKCGGHLGHVFPDGPKPTGLRYCINAVSMDFIKKEN